VRVRTCDVATLLRGDLHSAGCRAVTYTCHARLLCCYPLYRCLGSGYAILQPLPSLPGPYPYTARTRVVTHTHTHLHRPAFCACLSAAFLWHAAWPFTCAARADARQALPARACPACPMPALAAAWASSTGDARGQNLKAGVPPYYRLRAALRLPATARGSSTLCKTARLPHAANKTGCACCVYRGTDAGLLLLTSRRTVPFAF